MTPTHNRQLHAAWHQVCHVRGFDPKDRAQLHAVCAVAVGHEIHSTRELTDDEFSQQVRPHLAKLAGAAQPAKLSPAQWAMWQREWATVRAEQPDADEAAFLHAAVAGCEDGPCRACAALLQRGGITRDDVGNHQFSNLLAEFWKVTKPGDLHAQMRQSRMSRTNREQKIERELIPMLAVFMQDSTHWSRLGGARRYVASIIADKFTWPKWLKANHRELGNVRMADAADWLVAEFRDACPRPTEFVWRELTDAQVDDLLKTVWRAITTKQRAEQKRDPNFTMAELKRRAGLTSPQPPAGPEAEATAEEGAPF